jgi:acyl-CoA dehydrogenase
MLPCGPNYGRVSVGRRFHESRLHKTAPVNNNLMLAYVGQAVLGMPRSY